MVSGPKSWWDIGSDSQLTAVKWSSDGTELLLVTFGGELICFNPHRGAVTHRSKVHQGGYGSTCVDVAYMPNRDGYALLISSASNTTSSLTIKSDARRTNVYSSKPPDCLDYTLSPDGGFQLINARNVSQSMCQIRKRGSAQTDDRHLDLEPVTTCLARYHLERKVINPYVGKWFVKTESWGDYCNSDSDVIYCDSTGQLVSDDLMFVFTQREWWHSERGNKAVVIAPKGDLFTAQLDQVNWTTRTVRRELLKPVNRPGNWDYGKDDYATWGPNASNLKWSPDGRYIAGTLRDVVGLWRTSDGRFVRPIGCNTVIRKGSVGLFGIRDEDFWGSKLAAIHWSPDGKYIASVYDRRIFVWEVDTGRLVKEFFNSSAQSYATGTGSIFTLHSDGAIGWGPDSRSIVCVSLFGDVEIYNL